MGLELSYENGQTPISEEEKEGLLIKTISTKGELDEFEQNNIEEAVVWTLRRKFKLDQILSEKFICEVHKKMFSDVWGWAGKFRKTDKNIGVDKFQIAIDLRYLFDNCKYWIENKTYPEDEIAVRFKHRIVKIHPFPNGNGRHSRLCGDILISHFFKRPVFTWGHKSLTPKSKTRDIYINAVKAADHDDIKPLLDFARS
ncbi:MAG: mobile mystery protein B [Candidatus Delongbacteria bacterium]|jgi:Fic-DOC domain mobile mystery protein B|nr:mobile mystery protein B [Candidatus Delongbacteria bacterium]